MILELILAILVFISSILMTFPHHSKQHFHYTIFHPDLNLVDWSASNILAVALGNSVYLWNAGSGQIEQLCTLEGSETVCSVQWVQGGGSHLAVGTSAATVELWDCEKIKRLRVSDQF